MSANRLTAEYEKGVEEFIEFAKAKSDPTWMKCPCTKCANVRFADEDCIREHLFCVGIMQHYTKWIHHGESDDHGTRNYCDVGIEDMVEDAFEEFTGDPDRFLDLLSEAEAPLYSGCSKFTKLSGLVSLWNLKGRNGWSDTSFNDLLVLLHDMLPENNLIPETVYKAKTTLKALGMEYEKIHACPNDCILYRKEYADASICPTCKASRWQKSKDKSDRVNVPMKVMWYFPPIPRFKRMFKSERTATDLTWHHSKRTRDGYLRHPADSPAWGEVDKRWPEFAAEPRNLRLAISADGVNPFGNLSSQHSTWPVLMVIYNLPPSLCMKRKFMMLTTLISGPKQPGNDIDVYLAPLVDDLKRLWEVGVPNVYDAQRQETFTLKAVLLWTINDYPAYGTLSI